MVFQIAKTTGNGITNEEIINWYLKKLMQLYWFTLFPLNNHDIILSVLQKITKIIIAA